MIKLTSERTFLIMTVIVSNIINKLLMNYGIINITCHYFDYLATASTG